MPDFTLDDSTLGVLGGAQFTTKAATLDGEFREVQYRFSQSGSNEDMEMHFFEVHMTVTGVSEE